MPNRSQSLLFIAIITVFAGATISCRQRSRESEDQITVRTPVTITTVKFKPVVSTVEFPATSRFLNMNTIRATTTGNIEEIRVRQGDYIREGQLLFTLRTKESAAMGLRTSDTALVFNGLIRILSHKAGYISSISYQKGDYVQEGDPVAVISDPGSLVFILNIPYEEQALTTKSRTCTLSLPDGTQIKGTIAGKLPEMDIESQTVGFIIKPYTARQLPANMIARASIIRSSDENAQILPKQAVLGNETQTDFWVMKLINDSTAVRVDIRKGFESSEETEITEPHFTENDRIVLDGNYGLPDTASVTVTVGK
jgi:multidrug efflux pump subunit AcrA (membrane-fusion protein)